MEREEFLSNLKNLLSGESNQTAVLANAAAYIKEVYGYFWVGFYLVDHTDETLVLGPFQGTVACYRIKRGRGVCGTAWLRNETIVVDDVEQFPGHIACSSLSRSEIVIPLHDRQGQVCAVLDIDSDRLATFGPEERLTLEGAAAIVELAALNQ